MPEFTKPWWKSKGVIGGLVAVIAGLAGLFGVDVDQPVLTDIILQVGAAIGGVLAVIGRIKAEKPVHLGKE